MDAEISQQALCATARRLDAVFLFEEFDEVELLLLLVWRQGAQLRQHGMFNLLCGHGYLPMTMRRDSFAPDYSSLPGDSLMVKPASWMIFSSCFTRSASS